MVGQIKTVNGVKKIVPLTAEARAGNPVSTIIAIYSNLVPYGYLPCNGVQFDETQFPALYAILGDNHTPDLRECALVGAGQNDTDNIATHDVYDVGEFKDDQLQDHTHYETRHSEDFTQSTSGWVLEEKNTANYGNKPDVQGTRSGRTGTTTHGKQKGINYCIKATAGLDESDADYVLGVLAPVDEVTVDNMHSVTSNAVYNVTGKVTTWSGSGVNLYKIGRFVFGKFYTTESGTSPIVLSVPWKPVAEVRCAFINNNDDSYGGQMIIYIDGTVRFWKSGGGAFPSGSVSTCVTMYITDS